MRHLATCTRNVSLLWMVLVMAATAPVPSWAEAGDVDLVAMFQGEWQMRGKFRYAPEADWIPTRSRLVAEGKLGQHIILRHITARQINFSALDLITYNPKTSAVQYIYVNNQDTSALIFEGICKDDCRNLELEQVCGPAWPQPACDGRTTITFESESRFVARDFRPGPNGEPFMSREVFYTRADSNAD